MSVALTPILAAPILLLRPLLSGMHIDAAVLQLTIPYTGALAVGMLPLLLYFAIRRCLQAMDMVRPVAFALVTANIVNVLGNYALIYGRLGFPAMGAVGSGWSTTIARLYMAAVLVGYLFWYDHRHHTELLENSRGRRHKPHQAFGHPGLSGGGAIYAGKAGSLPWPPR